MSRVRSGVSALKGATMAMVAVAGLALPQEAKACSADPYIGAVCFMAANFCPRGYAVADGTTLDIASYNALFSLLGTYFGGDGRSTFKRPDLRGRVAVGSGQGPGTSLVPIGHYRGQEMQAIDVSQMPSHSHTADAGFSGSGGQTMVEASTRSGNASTPEDGAYVAKSADPIYRTGTTGTTVTLGGVSSTPVTGTVDVSIDATGGGQPFSTVDPGVGLTACIAIEGHYPPRN